jgi:GH24 family phage-related lysozyme (muramidase)
VRDSVRNAFLDFTRPLEGVVPWLYCDVKGLVSIGIGDLVDPIQLAMNLPLVHPDGSPADRSEIAAEWLRVKACLGAAQGGYLFTKNLTRLRLTDDGIRHLVASKLNANDAYISHRFANYESWPADAQLGVMSMCWAVGPAFQAGWPKFTAALLAQDFDTAAVECFMPEESKISGLRPRNRSDAMLFRNAAQVLVRGLDPTVLYWPHEIGPLEAA